MSTFINLWCELQPALMSELLFCFCFFRKLISFWPKKDRENPKDDKYVPKHLVNFHILPYFLNWGKNPDLY